MDKFEEAMDKYLKKDTKPNFHGKIAKIISGMIKSKKDNDNKSLVRYHEMLDKEIHAFVGEKGLTKEERK